MTFYQSRAQPCILLHLTVLKGRNISVGKWSDKLDTPDPYVLIRIPTAPNGKVKTKVVDNNPNPVWNEKFEFYMDPDRNNLLHLTLIEADIISDDVIDRLTFDLGELQLGKTLIKTFSFGGRGEVDIEMKTEYCADSTDLRYSQELCDGEKEFFKNRKKVVFEAMKSVLGDRAPHSLDEVPNIAVIGSGGGFRAMVGMTGAYTALSDTKILDCAMYTAGLSGSTWWMSVLYSHPDFPKVDIRQVISELRGNIKDNWMWLLVNPPWLYKRIGDLTRKRKRGQPVSFTDFFGYLIGDTILKGRDSEPTLSEQRGKIQNGQVPFPLYTCIHVQKDVSAQTFCEWIEFSPYEVGMAKFGAFENSKLFGNKYFRGHLVTNYPELPLHYLQGIWGSAFTILLQRMLQKNDRPEKTAKEINIKGDGRAELKDMVDSGEISYKVDEESEFEDSDEEDDGEDDDDDGDDNDVNYSDGHDNALVETADRKSEGSTFSNIMVKVKRVVMFPFTAIVAGYNRIFTSKPSDPKNQKSNDVEDALPELPKTKAEVKPKRKTSLLQSELEQENYWSKIMKKMVGKFEILRTRSGRAGLVHNYMRDLEVKLLSPSDSEFEVLVEPAIKPKRIFLVDSGLVFNSPFPPLLRPQRAVDMYISFDFSARDKDDGNPLTELSLAQNWAQENNFPFPPVNAEEKFDKEGMRECYVFKHPSDPRCPILVHFVLVNKTFKEYKEPGVKRETKEEKKESDFSLFEDPDDPYSTFNFHYPNKPFDRLSKLMEFNTLLCRDVIKDAMAECVVRRRNNPCTLSCV